MEGYDEFLKFTVPNIIPNLRIYFFFGIIIIIVIALIAYFYYNVKKIDTNYLAVIERLNKYFYSLGPCTVYLIPFIDNLTTIDLMQFSFLCEFDNIVNSDGISFKINTDTTAKFTISEDKNKFHSITSKLPSTQHIAYFIENNLKAILSIELSNDENGIYHLARNRDKFEKTIKEKLTTEMKEKCIEIKDFKITELKDSEGILEKFTQNV